MKFSSLLFALSVLGIFCLAKGSWPPACTINPCKNNGVCVPSSVGYHCRCTGPYTGRLCETVVNACLSNPCLGGGTCAVGSLNRHWYCICPPGKTGLRCEKVLHDCSSQPCQNGGSCCETQSGYTCDCRPGFTGNHCETDIDECLSEPCQNGGTCVDQVNGYSCTCRVGLMGRHCENKKPGCQSSTCLNGGSCAEASDRMWYCVCPKTYKGIQCEQRVNDCSSHPCQNGGSCCDKGDHYDCTCPEGFTGKHCETKVFVCPCQNGGTCPNNSSSCFCPAPYSGRYCENNICPCQNGATCYPNSFGCNCPYPYTGRYCETHYCDIQEPCHNGGTCIKIPNAFKCICPMPFTGNQCDQVMTTVSSKSEPISPSSTSSVSPTSLACYCVPYHGWCHRGYCLCYSSYYGPHCESQSTTLTTSTPSATIIYDHICDMSPPCGQYGQCIKIQTPPGYRCQCYPGYLGQSCQFSQPISSSSTSSVSPSTSVCNCVHDQGRCVGGTCVCHYSFYGPRCEFEHNACTQGNMCGSTAVCSKIQGDMYTCIPTSKLPPRTSLTSTPFATTSIPSCHCLNGGTCLSNGQCYCPIGLGGPNCGYYTDYCLCNPCKNGGSCHEQRDGYSCSCRPGFSGSVCEAGHVSSSSPISSSSVSPSSTSSYWKQKSIGDHICDFFPCHNGGVCIKTSNSPGYYCQCPAGYTGERCDVPYGYSTSTTLRRTTWTRWTGHLHTTTFTTSQVTSSLTTTIVTTPTSLLSTVSSAAMISKRSRRDIKKNVKISDVEDTELKRICKINERKAKKFFSGKQLAKKNWKNLHPGIKAVLIDLVANNDHRRLSGTHAQIKKAVAGNDLMKMSRIMAKKSLWKRVPVARYWKRKQMMKKAVKKPWNSLIDSQVVC